MPGKPLTQKQARLIAVIKSCIKKRGYTPTISEMAKDMSVTCTPINSMLRVLERNGYVEIVPGQARGVRVL